MDWENINWKDDDDHDAIVPMSCCKTRVSGCNENEDGINTEVHKHKLSYKLSMLFFLFSFRGAFSN